MRIGLLLMAGMLAACQSWQAEGPEHPPPPHRGAAGGAGPSGAGSGTASGMGSGMHGMHGMHGMGEDGSNRMCTMQQRIAEAPTPEERQALIEQSMPGMSQEARERHLQMMRERCQ